MVVVLVGFMGAGKTTVGHILAERLGLPFVDSDIFIEQRLGRSIRDIFAEEGEEHFRELEHQTVSGLLKGPDAVIALGGGALGDRRTRDALRGTRVVYLRVGFAEAMSRVTGDEYRPMLHRPDLIDVYEVRLPVYQDVAALVIDTNGRHPDAIAMDILRRLTAARAISVPSSGVFVTCVGGAYYAHIGCGLLDYVGELLPELPEAERAVVLEASADTDTASRVSQQLERRGLGTLRITVDDHAQSKTISAYERVVEALAEQAFHRDDLVVAVGGEFVMELAGFVAATFNRGMRLFLVPTTLAAQADVSVGGKNSVNLSRGYNLIGTIHQPVAVVSDVHLACANEGRGFRPGLAEMAKHALITNSGLRQFMLSRAKELLGRDAQVVRAAVERSVAIKADIVSRDEREQGDRIFLSYGHTFAYAFELVRDSRVSTPDGVLAVGLMAAAWLAYRQGRAGFELVEAHRELLEALGLPTFGAIQISDLQEVWTRDKKYRHGARFVVLNGLGNPEGDVAADDRTLTQVLEDLRQR